MRSEWSEEWMVEERGEQPAARGRDTDSSVDAQYEDQVVPEREWEHESDS